MSWTKSKPGPRPRSCLTCQKRRKKCDLGRPSCGRCLKGGHECLGYNDKPRAQREGSNASDLQLALASIAVPMSAIGSEILHSDALNHDSGRSSSSLPPNYYQHVDQNRPAVSIFGSALVYSMTRLTPRDKNNYATDYYNQSWPHDQSQLTTYRHARMRGSSHVTEHLQSESRGQVENVHLIQALYASIPPSVDATLAMRREHIELVAHEHHMKRLDYWLSPPPTPVINHMLAAPKSIWIFYQGAMLASALDRNMESTMLLSNSSLEGAAGWLTTQLPIVFLKFTAIGCRSGYLALQNALPAFLRLVAIDSNLHIDNARGNLVTSLPRTLGVPQCDLQCFVMYDTIASLLLGTSPLVEYDYDGECDPASHALEWVHGIPVVLVEIISQVNSWRAGSRVTLDDWQKLERRVLNWQSRLATAEGGLYVNTTVKLAIQEGWRHVTLIYIYMGMCGVSSHDERVQESISEIIRLGETVDNLPIGVHILPHCVIVGLAAKYEKHRAIVHKKLLSFKGSHVWLFHGLEFGRVLEHLWYGVGAGGAPVTWDDYVRSRNAVAPI
ncbi:hypothetical protein RSOLAG22IIIB_07968 [Rhizoctonia solani]|uniref:Zn(2)-C6 fungal-type domain-containing protein n=1 Tax=Rhizoctonia solani TaxID=456999 RepID=A0A0K6FRH3_9AGAM|nr:hypothetical protein RSOLAG22IIIB_07968 [Rhizoctonia solani]